MAFGSIIKTLFAGKDSVEISVDPFNRKAQHLPPKHDEASCPPPTEPCVTLQRSEIIGDGSRIVGYCFTPRCLSNLGLACTSGTIKAMKNEGLAQFAQRRLALIPITIDDWLADDFSPIVGPLSTFLVAGPTPDCDINHWIDTLKAIRSSGARVAIDSTVLIKHPRTLALINLLLIDFNDYTVERLELLIKKLTSSQPQLDLAVDGIGSWPEHRLCQSLGIRYSLGGFATTADEEAQTEELNQSRLVLLEMLNLLRREAEVDELVAVAKRDPGVTVKMVAMANSPMSGLSSPVSSINQALMVLGRETLYRWLALGVYRAGGNERDEALLEIALFRASFLELLGKESRSKQESDELYLVGMFSLLDSLLGMPMTGVIERMHLPPVVVDVLLRSEGPYGRYLMLAMAMGKNQSDHVARLAEELGIALETVEKHSSTAFAFAEEALKAS